jgi:hypothetical protein
MFLYRYQQLCMAFFCNKSKYCRIFIRRVTEMPEEFQKYQTNILYI